MKVYLTYTVLNLEAPQNQKAVNLAFIHQASSDIKRKFQWLKVFKGKNLAKLIAIATKVYNNKEAPKDQQIQGLAKVFLADKNWGPNG